MMKRHILAVILMLVMCFGLSGTVLAAGSEQTVVYAGTVEELEAALKSNVKIVLEGKDYVYENCLELIGLENVTIQGTEGTRIMSTSSIDLVVCIVNCQNVILENLILGHDIPTNDWCDTGVVSGSSSDFSIINCDIFGCGLEGIHLEGGSVTVQKSIIHDCSGLIGQISNSAVVFEDCTFSGNGYESPDTYGVRVTSWGKDASCTFYGCVFTDNKNPLFVKTSDQGDGFKAIYTCEDCIFSGNRWDDNDIKLVESIVLSPEETNIKVGDSLKLSLEVFPTDADDKSVKWYINFHSPDEPNSYDSVIMDEEGVVTAVREGSASIYCTAKDGSGEWSNICRITVEKADSGTSEKPDENLIQSIVVAPSEISMKVGDIKTLSYSSTPSNADREMIVWHSTDSDVASVNQEGMVTAIKEGTAEIYCVSQDGGNVESNRCIIQVTTSGMSSGNASSGSSGSSSSGSSGSRRIGGSSVAQKSTTLPAYVLRGTWTQIADGTWQFTDTLGIQSISTWAAVENLYANETLGQQTFDWFRFDDNGIMMLGWYYDSDDGFWYYLNPVSDGTLGRMMTGWVLINEDYYYFSAVSDGHMGRMYINETTPDGYQVDENGKWIK